MRMFIEYDPEIVLRVDGVCIGYFIKSQLASARVPGKGPGLPPNTVEVTDREQDGLNLDDLGWVEFSYDPNTDTFAKFDVEKDVPESLDGTKGGNP